MITEEEFLAICNKVREAGEGEAITEILPGIPNVARQCLIAVNLNFDCTVAPRGKGCWHMSVHPELAERIAKALDTEILSEGTIRLPAKLGELARVFDSSLSRDSTWVGKYDVRKGRI